jgi:phosphate acetyltransferase
MFEYQLLERARTGRKRIVLPEGGDDRVLRAAATVLARGIADLTILGDEAEVRGRAVELGLDLSAAQVLSPFDPQIVHRFAEEYAELRKHKGITYEKAADTVTDVSYFGTMMVHLGLADGMVSGAAHTTAHTIRPAFEIIKTRPGVSVVSSVFLMALADRVLVYGDCAVIPDPTAAQLADIAISSAATARQFGIEPRVAMLSYSTGESGSGRTSTRCARRRRSSASARRAARRRPDPVRRRGRRRRRQGEDARLAVAGRATVFVFPDLNTGNNTYKAVQRSAGAVAMGRCCRDSTSPSTTCRAARWSKTSSTRSPSPRSRRRTSSRETTHDRRPRHQQRLLVVQVPARRRRVPDGARVGSRRAHRTGDRLGRHKVGMPITRANCRSPTTPPASR